MARNLVVVDRVGGETRFYFVDPATVSSSAVVASRYSLEYPAARLYSKAEAKKVIKRLRDFCRLAVAIENYGLVNERVVYPALS